MLKELDTWVASLSPQDKDMFLKWSIADMAYNCDISDLGEVKTYLNETAKNSYAAIQEAETEESEASEE
jgi:hypothetical protein